MEPGLPLFAAGAVAVASTLGTLRSRIGLSRAKHASLAGHAWIATQLTRQVPYYEFDDDAFFRSDGAPDAIVARRREGFRRLAELHCERFGVTDALTRATAAGVSDLQFTGSYRVPYPYSHYVRKHLGAGAFVASSSGVTVTDLDGNVFYDLTGSYGVNLLGNDFYKQCIDRGVARARDLGPVLGAYHPIVADNVLRLLGLSGQDEVSFHMSGTEAVMQAVRLARYHTRRRRIVRFCGAYHGWWGDVQPGVGNPMPARDTFTLRDMDDASLAVLRRRRDVACVLVNPLQALHPNRGAPTDSALVDSSRSAGFDRAAYGDWLRRLRRVCTERGIVLVFDEVFLGFRLAPGGAQEYYGVRADLVTYGKTIGGGLPIGVVCGRRELMRRFRDEEPANICFARGTFNSHPYVMAAMNEFLRALETPAIRGLYAGLDAAWDERAAALNRRLDAEGVPVRVANMSTVWTTLYTTPSRYNWMLQFYLRAEGIGLSWVGTGRLLFGLNWTAADWSAVADRFVAAARRMSDDVWWWSEAGLTNAAIRRRIVREMATSRLRRLAGSLAL